jgi:flagellar FliL protein
VPLDVLIEQKRRTDPMAETAEDTAPTDENVPRKRSKILLILSLVLAILGGGGGFMAVQMGLIGGTHEEEAHEKTVEQAEALPDLAFVPMETLVINLPQNAQAKHLLFKAELEVEPAYSQEVTDLMPRIVDVLNAYLRAVDIAELENPTSLIRLRAQMLRRVQVVVGEGRVKDVLIMEFVLN